MRIDKKKHFARLPVYLVIVYFLASIPITIYLAQNAIQSTQYAQSDPSSTPQYVSPTLYCLANDCPTKDNLSPTFFGGIVSPSPNSTSPQTSPMPSTKLSPINPSGGATVSLAPKPSSLVPTNKPCTSTSVSGQNYSTSARAGGDSFIHALIKFLTFILDIIRAILGLPPQGDGNNPCPTGTGMLAPTKTTSLSGTPPAGVTLSPMSTTSPSGGALTTPAVTPAIGGGTSMDVRATFYSYFSFNGTPRGPVFYASLRNNPTAGGIGTYDNPLTFSAPGDPGYYKPGTIIYVPEVQKYFIREDKCRACSSPSATQVDLYVGNPSEQQGAGECARAITTNENILTPIIMNPPSNLTYDPTPIWNQATGKCMTLH